MADILRREACHFEVAILKAVVWAVARMGWRYIEGGGCGAALAKQKAVPQISAGEVLSISGCLVAISVPVDSVLGSVDVACFLKTMLNNRRAAAAFEQCIMGGRADASWEDMYILVKGP